MTRQDRLRRFMQRQGLTRHAVCSRSSLSRAALKKILDGADCRVSTWERLAKALGVSPAWLLFGYQVEGHNLQPGGMLSVHYDPLVCGDGDLQRFVNELHRCFPSTQICLLQEGVQLRAEPNAAAGGTRAA